MQRERDEIDKIFHTSTKYVTQSQSDNYVRVPNIYKTSDGYGVPYVNYNYTYYPIPKNSFVNINGITQKTFPQTHWYKPNNSNITYRSICMNKIPLKHPDQPCGDKFEMKW